MTRIDVMMALGKALRTAKIDAELILYEQQIRPLAREWADKTGWTVCVSERAFRFGGGSFNGLSVR